MALLVSAITFVVFASEVIAGTEFNEWLQSKLPTMSKTEYSLTMAIAVFAMIALMMLVKKMINQMKGM